MTVDVDDLCGRCLANTDTRIAVRARWGQQSATAPNPVNPLALRQWVEARLYGDGAVFEVNDMTGAFVPVATWHGDPVCPMHLFECRQRELRS